MTDGAPRTVRSAVILDVDPGRLLEAAWQIFVALFQLGPDESRSEVGDVAETRHLKVRLPDGTTARLPELAELLSERYVRALVDDGRINEARSFLMSLQRQDPRLEIVEQWKGALALPAAHAGESATGKDPRRDAEWLRVNHEGYAGSWVALREGELLDSDPDVRALARRLAARCAGSNVAVFRVPS